MRDDDIVLSAIGAVTSFGRGLACQLAMLADVGAAAGALGDFNPAAYLGDRRILKAISFRDAVGLLALEDCAKQAQLDPDQFVPERIGLYVGAPSSSAFDTTYFEDALRASMRPPAACDMVMLGRELRGCKPTGLLFGLPNNVMCYGSIILGARGPNSNYTSGAVSGALAFANAAQQVSRGSLDLAFAGGYSVACDGLQEPLLRHLGVLDGRKSGQLADGAAFVAIERRATAIRRGIRPMVRFLAAATSSDGLGPWRREAEGHYLAQAIHVGLSRAHKAPQDVGLVLFAAPHGGCDMSCIAALLQAFPDNARPALGYLERFGQRLEASAILELGVLAPIFATGTVPRSAQVAVAPARSFPTTIAADRKVALVVASSASGDHICLVLQREDNDVSWSMRVDAPPGELPWE